MKPQLASYKRPARVSAVACKAKVVTQLIVVIKGPYTKPFRAFKAQGFGLIGTPHPNPEAYKPQTPDPYTLNPQP